MNLTFLSCFCRVDFYALELSIIDKYGLVCRVTGIERNQSRAMNQTEACTENYIFRTRKWKKTRCVCGIVISLGISIS